ncbi:hypothetical protein DH2020_014184 [Rehmannia glutinosa]|uniref:methylated diphthine methylhydrolase n=1 Tax=Rehmannia glutinosa TaxID=99300 RepID=A0ABR0WZ69_REHGL
MDVGHCILDGNADAVEFCPHDSFYNVLAASTYVLQEGDCPSRSGCITLFDVDADGGRLELIQKVETAGIFDIKWSPELLQNPARPLLAQADADGCVKIYSLQCSDSDDSEMREWKAHDFEVWAASFDIQQPMLVYTGSDDCKFCCWDLRDGPSNLVFQNTKVHKMGICCIAKSPFDPNTLLTGSYDECLRVWDVRSTSKPVNESSICLGGGVWRIKHHPSIQGLVLTACMHNGFAIVKFEGDQADVVETYEKHGSLAYGADWQRGDVIVGGRRKSSAIATCSFYDRLLRVWKPEGDNLKRFSSSSNEKN